jgi:uncharacterized protein YcaQ
MQFSQEATRNLMLVAMGLHARQRRRSTKADVLATIRAMNVLQIDTIHVVARSPYLVLWSRLGDYKPQWLDELLAEGKLFEYWSHAACFLPIEDYPLYRSLTPQSESRNWKHIQEWLDNNRALADNLLEHIRANGAVRSSDFERTDGQKGVWWNWKAEKVALEQLFMNGDLMITKRHNFQRIYDLRERVLPSWSDDQMLDIAEVRRTFALLAVRALGITQGRWVADYFRTKMAPTLRALRELADAGQLLTVEVEGWKEPGYIHPELKEEAEQVIAGKLRPTLTTLLSPFDPLVWDRGRALSLFGFDYQIECYTPEPKRRYGYFTLPILRRGALIGRLDAKAHRKEQIFEVKALFLEPGVPPIQALADDIAGALRECAAWHKTPEVRVVRCDPPEFAELLAKALGDEKKSEVSSQ